MKNGHTEHKYMVTHAATAQHPCCTNIWRCCPMLNLLTKCRCCLPINSTAWPQTKPTQTSTTNPQTHPRLGGDRHHEAALQPSLHLTAAKRGLSPVPTHTNSSQSTEDVLLLMEDTELHSCEGAINTSSAAAQLARRVCRRMAVEKSWLGV
jgi:hypothetical protein